MHIDIPDDLWAKFVQKAKGVLPSEGDKAAFKVMGSLVQNFIQSKAKSEILLGTKEAKALSLSNIDDTFFDAFLEGCSGLYPESDKPEIDYLLDCMASLVDVDKRVILLHSVDAAHYDKLSKLVAETMGGGDQSIYLLLTRLLLKSFGDRLFITTVEGDASTIDLEEKDKVMVVLDGVNVRYKDGLNKDVISTLLGNLIGVIGNTTSEDYRKFGSVLEKIFDYKASDLDLFIRNLIAQNASGKLMLANLSRAPMASLLTPEEKADHYTIIFNNVSGKALRKLDIANAKLTADLKQLQNMDTTPYNAKGIGFLIYLLDLMSLADTTQFNAEFDNKGLDNAFQPADPMDSLFKK